MKPGIPAKKKTQEKISANCRLIMFSYVSTIDLYKLSLLSKKDRQNIENGHKIFGARSVWVDPSKEEPTFANDDISPETMFISYSLYMKKHSSKAVLKGISGNHIGVIISDVYDSENFFGMYGRVIEDYQKKHEMNVSLI